MIELEQALSAAMGDLQSLSCSGIPSHLRKVVPHCIESHTPQSPIETSLSAFQNSSQALYGLSPSQALYSPGLTQTGGTVGLTPHLDEETALGIARKTILQARHEITQAQVKVDDCLTQSLASAEEADTYKIKLGEVQKEAAQREAKLQEQLGYALSRLAESDVADMSTSETASESNSVSRVATGEGFSAQGTAESGVNQPFGSPIQMKIPVGNKAGALVVNLTAQDALSHFEDSKARIMQICNNIDERPNDRDPSRLRQSVTGEQRKGEPFDTTPVQLRSPGKMGHLRDIGGEFPIWVDQNAALMTDRTQRLVNALHRYR